MKIKKDEEEDVSVNSERMGSEDKIFTDKLRIHSDININCIVNATFSRHNNKSDLLNISKDKKHNTEINDNKSINGLSEYSLISKDINSHNNYKLRKNTMVKNSLFGLPDDLSFNSNCQPSTSHNSHIQTQREVIHKSLFETSTKFLSPQKTRSVIGVTPEKVNQKLMNSYSGKQLKNELTDDATEQELKKISMILRLKEKEIKDKTSMYQSLKDKFLENKKKLHKIREISNEIKITNSNLKKLICGVISNKIQQDK